MALVDLVGCGMVELDNPHTYQLMRKEVRKELRAQRIRLQQAGSRDFYNVSIHGKRSGHRVRAHIAKGTLVECCKAVAARITPSDHEG